MKAILKTKDGFTKEMEVVGPSPQPRISIAVAEDTSLIDYKEQQDIKGLADVVYTERVFILKSVVDPRERIEAFRSYNTYRDEYSAHYEEQHIWRQHENEYGTNEPVAIYEEYIPYTPEKKKELVDEAFRLGVERGWIKPEIPVEVEGERFIELDNEYQDP